MFERGGGKLVDEVLGSAGQRHLILLHGWGTSRDSLRGIGVLFQHACQVHLVDLPGFGDAPAPPSDWDTTHYADLVATFLAERVHGSVIVVGHSFGGRIALRLGARRLAAIHGIVLMGVPGLPQAAWSRRALRRAGVRLLRQLLTVVRPVTGPAPLAWHTATYGSKDYLAAGELRPILVRTVNEDLTASARGVTCPTLLLYGADDTETPPDLARRYHALIGESATLAILPHKDHYLHTGTGAHLCAHLIRRWLHNVG